MNRGSMTGWGHRDGAGRARRMVRGMTVAAAHGRLRLSCRLLAGTGSVLLAVTTLSHTARAQAGCRAQDVRIELSARQVGLMVGYMWGRGVLHDGAHVYPFSVRGGGMLSLGGARVSGQGCVRNLARIRDFNGTYWTVGGTATLGHGATGIDMENARGVDIRFSGRSHGAQLSGQVSRLYFHLAANAVQP
ncbi:hypothetical protein [Komagataeibacter rhaeticus]|uniref:hypothetical protein n=1 Tax=Komagataeibacter rhaeticus TaxID=215221 RepID=UPI0039ED9924